VAPRGFHLQPHENSAVFYQRGVAAALLWSALNSRSTPRPNNIDAQKHHQRVRLPRNTGGLGLTSALLPYNEADTYAVF